MNRSYSLKVARDGDPERPGYEALVQQAFASRHGASLHHFMPNLLGVHRPRGDLCGVVGFRGAEEEPLFLERYLDAPVEQLVSARFGHPVGRDAIVEVGNLAGPNCRGTMRLVAELPQFLLARGRRFIVFTATDVLRDLLERFGAPLVELAPARADAVAGTGDSWGSYYERDPRVMVGHLPDGLRMRERVTAPPLTA